jgi:hypothetical protein
MIKLKNPVQLGMEINEHFVYHLFRRGVLLVGDIQQIKVGGAVN